MNCERSMSRSSASASGAEFIPIYQRHPRRHVRHLPTAREKLNKVGEAFGVRAVHAHEDVLADPDVDFVHINTPIPEHAWQSIAALKAGKHVMCTVPMATTVEECRQIVELARKPG